MDPNELVEVYVARNPGRVVALKLLLEQEGVPHFIDGENQGGLAGVVPVRVLAPASAAEHVRKIIMAHEPT